MNLGFEHWDAVASQARDRRVRLRAWVRREKARLALCAKLGDKFQERIYALLDSADDGTTYVYVVPFFGATRWGVRIERRTPKAGDVPALKETLSVSASYEAEDAKRLLERLRKALKGERSGNVRLSISPRQAGRPVRATDVVRRAGLWTLR